MRELVQYGSRTEEAQAEFSSCPKARPLAKKKNITAVITKKVATTSEFVLFLGACQSRTIKGNSGVFRYGIWIKGNTKTRLFRDQQHSFSIEFPWLLDNFVNE